MLFISYINDSILKFIIFADDTNLFYSKDNLNVIFEDINKQLQTLTRWVSVNRISVNITKRNYILFYNKNVKKFKGQIKIDSTEVDTIEKKLNSWVLLLTKNYIGKQRFCMLKIN